MPLQRPSDGPYEVILRGSNNFRIRVGDREENIAIGCQQTAHTDQDTLITVAHPHSRWRLSYTITKPRKEVLTHLPPYTNTSRSCKINSLWLVCIIGRCWLLLMYIIIQLVCSLSPTMVSITFTVTMVSITFTVITVTIDCTILFNNKPYSYAT